MVEFADGTERLVRKTTIIEGPLSEIERGDILEAAVRSALEDGDLLVTVHTDQHPRREIAGIVEPVGEHGSDEDSDRGGDEPDDSSSTGDDSTDAGGPDRSGGPNGDTIVPASIHRRSMNRIPAILTGSMGMTTERPASGSLTGGVSLATSTIDFVRSLLSYSLVPVSLCCAIAAFSFFDYPP